MLMSLETGQHFGLCFDASDQWKCVEAPTFVTPFNFMRTADAQTIQNVSVCEKLQAGFNKTWPTKPLTHHSCKPPQQQDELGSAIMTITITNVPVPGHGHCCDSAFQSQDDPSTLASWHTSTVFFFSNQFISLLMFFGFDCFLPHRWFPGLFCTRSTRVIALQIKVGGGAKVRASFCYHMSAKSDLLLQPQITITAPLKGIFGS